MVLYIIFKGESYYEEYHYEGIHLLSFASMFLERDNSIYLVEINFK